MKFPTALLSCALLTSTFAGDLANDIVPLTPASEASVFDRAIRPITTPTLFDLAVPRTSANLIYMNQSMPDTVALANGGSVDVGGGFDVYALQLEYALDERTSIIATKDGFIDFNPDETLSSQSGFANLGAGIKRALVYKPEAGYIMSGIIGVEIPTGNSDVWQGEGKGALDLRLTNVKLMDSFQFASSASLHIPFDDAESLTGMINLHASYEVSPWFIPVVELNWLRVIEPGDGSFGFNDQGGTLVPANIAFEGGDLVNFGAANSDDNADIVNLALGFRSRISDNATLGVAYEFPLTDDSETLLEDRITASLNYVF